MFIHQLVIITRVDATLKFETERDKTETETETERPRL